MIESYTCIERKGEVMGRAACLQSHLFSCRCTTHAKSTNHIHAEAPKRDDKLVQGSRGTNRNGAPTPSRPGGELHYAPCTPVSTAD
jgi:hypothetical protein